MPLNHFVTLGRSGLRVSPLCLGAMTFGEDWGFGSSVGESRAVIDRYLGLGGNFIDTANVYTKGHSEAILGDFFAKRRGSRDRVVLATKFFGTLYPGDPNAGGANAKSVRAACEQSLRRLRTDYIDLYWLHCWDALTPIEETLRAVDDLVRAGKVRYLGFSDTPAWKCSQAQTLAAWRGWTPLAAIQVEYSLLERTVEGELLPMARELGLGVTPWSPLKYGVLSGKFTRANRGKPGLSRRGAWVESALTDKAFDVIDALGKVASDLGVSSARAALAWVQAQPGVSSSIIGARTVKHLEDNARALEVRLKPRHLEALGAASKPALDFPAAFIEASGAFSSGGCTVNGRTYPVLPMQPASDKERW